ncbi:transposase [Patescibacteria group bacterium]|nr:transposase [Patescibacteria group bacterium]
MSRGNNFQSIFLDDEDRGIFLAWLANSVHNHNLLVHAYCLMGNHYHLLIETLDPNLSQIMRDLNSNYTQWFNAKYSRVGHLLQGRFKSFIIERETYLLKVASYIVLNPVRAGLVKSPQDYIWSSYVFTAGYADPPEWLCVDWILDFFGKTKKQAENEYQQFINEAARTQDPHEDVKHGSILGSQQFIDWIWLTQTNGSEDIKEFPREQRIVGRPSLEEIFVGQMTKQERDEAIKFARFRCGYLTTEIAKYVGLDRAVVGRISRGKYNKSP